MQTIPRELLVFFAAMLPIGELRAGIPLGLLLGMPGEAVFFWAELGNILIILLVLKALGPISAWLMKHSKWCDRVFTKLFHHTRTKHSAKMEKMGEVFIVLLTTIPLPGTGAWTGALLAFLFNVPYWRAILLIFIGNILCGILLLFGVGGAIELYKFFVK